MQSDLARGFEFHKTLETLSFTGNAFYGGRCAFDRCFENRISPELVAAVKLDRFRRRADETGLLQIARSCLTLKRVGANKVTWDVVRRGIQDGGEEVVEMEPRDVDSIVW